MFLFQVRRKKSTLSEVKLAVIGAPGVGKSGLLIIFYFMLNELKFLDFVHIYDWGPLGLNKQRCAAFQWFISSFDCEISYKAVHRRV